MKPSRYLDARTGPQEPPRSAHLRGCRRGASRHGARRGARARPGRSGAASRSRTTSTCVLLCVPDGADRRRSRATMPDGPLLGHCSGATGLEVFGGREGFSPAPADVHAPRRDARGAAAARARRSTARASARSTPRAALAERLGMSRDARRARGPRRLPRGGRDRRELPRRARGVRGAARGHRGHHPRAARPARARHRAPVGRARARSAR